MLNLTSDYNDEKTNYDELKTKHEELLATNANIVCDHEVVIATYKAIIIEKDAIISAKEGELINLQNEAPCRFQVSLIKNSGTDQSFRWKPKKVKGSSKIVAISKCEFSECNNSDVDLIRCNVCSKYVCELCNDIPVPKVKQIFNKCNTLYFICKTCDQEIHDPGQHKMDVNVQNPEADKDELIKSFQEIFDTKLTTMEAKLTTMEAKLTTMEARLTTMEARLTTMFGEKLTSIDNIMKTSNICTDSTLPDSSLDSDVSNSVNPNLPTYASKVLKLPQEVKKIMLDAENEKRLEENEQEWRAKNFIIHGADEIVVWGNSPMTL